eukprot:881386-Amphidinium_carterae.1
MAKPAAKPMTRIHEQNEAGSYGTAEDAEAETEALANEPNADDAGSHLMTPTECDKMQDDADLLPD